MNPLLIDKINAYVAVFILGCFKLVSVLFTVKKTYKNIPTYSISKEYRQKQEPQNLDLVYGELSPSCFLYLLALLPHKPNIKLYDLGCGDAKLLLSAVLFYKNLHATGIEKIPTLQKIASEIALSNHKKIEKNHSALVILEGDFLKKDFLDADVLYINGCALNKFSWEQLNQDFNKLNIHSYIISIERKMESPLFSLFYFGWHNASWGKARVYIYIKTE